MKCLRLTLICSVVAASFFLSGFKKPAQHHAAAIKNQPSPEDHQQQPKPLDLTLPIRNESFQESPETTTTLQTKSTDVLTEQDESKIRSVELQGRLIMSQEPEAEKSKSTDGAGIMINLRH